MNCGREQRVRSSPRKRGPRATERGSWIPACAGMSGIARRAFIAGLTAGAAWPLAARAQQERMRHIGVLLPAVADDPVWQARLAAFYQGLALLGWTIGRNVRVDVRWGTPNAGNATGFMSWEFSIGGKWLELLKEIAPGVARVAVLRDASQGFATSIFAAIQTAAPSLGVEVIPVNMREASEIERSITTFARSPNGGLIPSPSAAVVRHRDLIVTLAARHKLPAVYWERFFVAAGGLISYGPDLVDQFRQAAGYVDRILKGEVIE